MKALIVQFCIGMMMGAANVIPGVSGGTVAFITGIFERLVAALKSIDAEALRLFARGRFAALLRHVDFAFLAALGGGVVVALLTLARVFEWALERHEVPVFAFFFGLIAASVPVVGRMVKRWGAAHTAMFLVGTGAAASLAFLSPASENAAFPYLLLCGVAAFASMIIPGLSGSLVLLLMGNYALVLRAVNERDLGILMPVAVGAVVGLVALSRLLNWLFRRFHDLAVALITGFVAGSLLTIWPWKEVARSEWIEVGERVEEKILAYRWLVPEMDGAFLVALLAMGAGVVIVLATEWGFGRGRGKR